MPVIILMRHASNDYVDQKRLAGRLPGIHLNKAGVSQAVMIAEHLRGSAIQAVYSSPLERAMETAAPVAQAFGLPIQPRQGLVEVDFGEWQGQKLSSLRRLKLWKWVQSSPSRVQFPGGETFLQAQQRIVQELEQLCARHQDRDQLVCVSHADLIKLAVAYFSGLPLDFFQRLQIAPASLTTIYLGAGGFSLVNLNYEGKFNLPGK